MRKRETASERQSKPYGEPTKKRNDCKNCTITPIELKFLTKNERRYVNFMPANWLRMINDVYTDRQAAACTSIQNDHFIGSTNANANANSRWEVDLKRRWLFFVVTFYLVVRTTHFIACPMITFQFCFLCRLPNENCQRLRLALRVLIFLLLDFNSGCRCNANY